MQTKSAQGINWIKLSVLYLIVGVVMGMMMGATRDFTLRPVHAHVNLLGWTTLALAGLIYTVFPKAGLSKLAKAHFWLMNIGLPVMMAALATIFLTGNMQIVPVLVASEFTVAASVLAFAANIFLNLKREE
ncbi:cbb3-type cytochrome c oxidase subunit I [Massilia endophytica]|uniref:cbb3-type cytochrome c oxidase subunit I n=1 Tax=Massilia endophytica TaxID=2899220 RepID=UPI001E60428A|nr:cbb3-type cytochrome c oxidase subunit I [Massilia endophytica]UGQ45637.1 cbb3-type cytochrome c oxidase subunit I [Massilia endophytica]